jgi:hypothetical protein
MCAATVLMLLAIGDVTAATYRWVDAEGKVHYSDVLPPKAAGLGHQELSRSGRVVKETPRTLLSPEERRRLTEEAEAKADRGRREAARERHDRALLSTYANLGELELARERAVSMEQAILNSLRLRQDASTKKLTYAREQLDRQRAAGHPESAGMAQMRDEAQKELAQLDEAIRHREKSLADVMQRFEADKARLIELRGPGPQ